MTFGSSQCYSIEEAIGKAIGKSEWEGERPSPLRLAPFFESGNSVEFNRAGILESYRAYPY
jgi:hypothetical protein